MKMVATKDYKGMLLFAFENGKAAKVPLESYATKTNRKKLTAHIPTNLRLSDFSIYLRMKRYSSRRHLEICSLFTRVHSLYKTTRSTQGVAVLKPKKGHRLSA